MTKWITSIVASILTGVTSNAIYINWNAVWQQIYYGLSFAIGYVSTKIQNNINRVSISTPSSTQGTSCNFRTVYAQNSTTNNSLGGKGYKSFNNFKKYE